MEIPAKRNSPIVKGGLPRQKEETLDKQRALAAMQGVVRTIPVSDTTQIIDIARKTEAGSYKTFSITPPDWKEAVDLIMRRMEFFPDRPFEGPYFIPAESVMSFTFDGDTELLVTFAAGISPSQYKGFDENHIQKVRVRRRQARIRLYGENVLLALCIHKELRNILPAYAQIVAAEGDYVIIVPSISSIYMQMGGTPGNLARISESQLKPYQDLHRHFVDNWAVMGHNDEKVVLVCRVPAVRDDVLSRSGKTQHIHRVYAKEPVVAGFAQEVWEFYLDVARAEGAETQLGIVKYNMKELDPCNFCTGLIFKDLGAIEALHRDVLPLLATH